MDNLKVVSFSTANHPDSWAVDPGCGTIDFKTSHDAKLAETLFRGMQQEIDYLRLRMREKNKATGYSCVRYNGCIDAPECTKADCCLIAKGFQS